MTSRQISLHAGADLDGFRQAVRALVAEDVAPDQVTWMADDAPLLPLPGEEAETAAAVRVRGGPCPERTRRQHPILRGLSPHPVRSRALDLSPRERVGVAPSSAPARLSSASFADTFSPEPLAQRAREKADASAPPLLLPRSVRDCVAEAVPHLDPERYALLYALIWRVLHGARNLPEVASDPLVHRLDRMRRAVRRDIHRMHAFVRFRRAAESGAEHFVAWFEPDHFILEAAAPFFVERFRALSWSILTPVGSAHWDRERLSFGPPGRPEDAPKEDAFEVGWRDYYESTFNPARTNPDLMRSHMPKKYWRNLPEAASIPRLIRSAASRVETMLEQEASMPTKRTPEAALRAMGDAEPKSLEELNRIIREAGPLVPGATQAVFGEGPTPARIVLVGEQPGDQEDIQGRPFVGPAGKLLDRALRDAGLDRRDLYLTNAIKHFKFEQRGLRRIHAKPTVGEVKHYRPWLMKELDLVHPAVVVALGATAVLALTGKQIPITRARGPAQLSDRFRGFITVHPSYLLRLPDEETKRGAYAEFVSDLEQVRALAEDGRAVRAAAE